KDAVLGLRLIHNAPRLQHRVYNVASGVPTTNADVAAAAHAAQPSFSVQLPAGNRSGSGGVGYSSIDRVQGELGYAPRCTIGSGMAEYMSWLASHEE
ncbi:MAG: NAD-dependent epimerase/dehydratase family protein, partial [Chloroflexota bacterium]